MMQKQEGFTLIELMIVVAIIAILAAIAIPLYLNYTTRAQSTEALSLASGLKPDVVAYYNNNGTFTNIPNNSTSANQLGASMYNTITGKYVSSVYTANGKITATFCTNGATVGTETCGANAALTGHALTLSPVPTGGSIDWICGVDSPQIYKFVGTNCRNTIAPVAP